MADRTSPSRRRLVLIFGALVFASLIALYPTHTRDRVLALARPAPTTAQSIDGIEALQRFVTTFPQLKLPHPDPAATSSAGVLATGTSKADTDTANSDHDSALLDLDNEEDADNFYLKRTRAGRAAFDWPTTGKMFIFGDSFSSLPTRPDYRRNGVGDGHPTGLNKHIGLKWADYLYNTFKDPKAMQYWNFARDGATIDFSLVPPRLEESGSFDDQVAEFKALFTPMPGPKAVNWHGENTLFVVLLGINDVRREFSPPALHRTANQLPPALMHRVSTLYGLGARHFLFFSLAALDHAPKYALDSGIGHNVSSHLRRATACFNTKLPQSLAEFEESHPHANTMLFDWEGLYATVSSYPEVFGLTDCSRFTMTVRGKKVDQGRMGLCYQDPSHPTWTIAQTLARSVNGFLHRHSRSFWLPDTTDTEIHA